MKENRREQLFNSITDVDERFIEEAQTEMHRKKSHRAVKWIGLAACLCLVAGGALLWSEFHQPSGANDGPAIVTGEGVAIPPRVLDVQNNTSEANMIAFFIYQGRWYEHYAFVDMNENLVGEYLGTATGSIDEWSEKDEYVELSGSVQGDFYAVNGYDPNFMLCMRSGIDGELSLYICNNGITLSRGSELYEDRLHLAENYRGVTFESQASWNYSKGEIHSLDTAENKALTDFISALNDAAFILKQDVPFDKDKDAEAVSVFDSCLYHLYFQMEDGITVHLRLIEGGYVFFDGMMDVAVRIPPEAFDPLIEQLAANEK